MIAPPSRSDRLVNSTRLAKFDTAITAALESESLDFFREVVAHYVREYDAKKLDVAAALAVVLQGDTPLLLDETPEPFAAAPAKVRSKSDAGPRERRGGERPELALYRINVGRRHRVQPRQRIGPQHFRPLRFQRVDRRVNMGGQERRFCYHAGNEHVEFP